MSQESPLTVRSPACSKRILALSRPRHLALEAKQKEAKMISLEKMEKQISLKRKKDAEKSKNFAKLLQEFENNQNQLMLDEIFQKVSKILVREILKNSCKKKSSSQLDENRELLIKTAFANIFQIKPNANCDLVFEVSKVVANFVEPLIKFS